MASECVLTDESVVFGFCGVLGGAFLRLHVDVPVHSMELCRMIWTYLKLC